MTDTTVDHRVLGQLALGYSPMIDRHRAITALRLTVFPLQPEARPDAGELLALLADTWPADAGRVSLNVAGEALLGQLLGCELPPHLMLEVPAFLAADAAHAAALTALYKAGNTLLIKGRPVTPLPRELLPCFAYSIIDLADERRDGLPPPGGVSRNIPHVQSGVRTLAEMNDAFGRGAIAVLGWPIDDPAVAGAVRPGQARPELQAIVELINRVDRAEPIERLEAVMKNDPTMAYKLLRYINSPAFGLSVEISSFRHAIMMLGYQRLKRWLALLLASGGRDANLKPVIYAAVRRGLLMEELGREAGCDDETRGDLFICGVFSLLDRLMQQPFDVLLNSVPTSDSVRAALVSDDGPHHPYLELVRAVESASVYDIRQAADTLMMGMGTVNRSVLRALAAARQLD
ncbi:HDOD domain-containing protein [Ideonella sp. DXS22W]|uniref:HDOD domain-containing protein n=1 Tax=Pseudaquabacterium inlustre TaxID=2984192 RepID=A0ABU9C9S2_9BURK